MKQIIVITDGCSNVGISPVIAAAQAKEQGIIVNVIGIIGSRETDERGISEIHEIAAAGGGMSRVVTAAQLSQTMQMMTRKTVAHTIQQVVGKELQTIFGTSQLEAVPPDKRAQVVQVIDDLSETARLKVALLIDTSASMKAKLAAVKDAVYDLQLSLQSRTGESKMAVFHFPGNIPGRDDAERMMDWSDDLANLSRLLYKINMRGATPTGPALLKVLQYFEETAGTRDRAPAHEDGMLSDYVV